MIKIIKAINNPITFIGECASICANNKDPDKFYKIGKDCLNSDHGRAFEYVDVVLEISEYSARTFREIYTNTQGNTKLQESTRYVDMQNFEYYTPDTIEKNEEAKIIYDRVMYIIKNGYRELSNLKIPKEDSANMLPLGYESKIIYKINLRAIIHMFEIRTCNRTYKEYRAFMKELKYILSGIDEEWGELADNYFICKCDKVKVCYESKNCGKYPKGE